MQGCDAAKFVSLRVELDFIFCSSLALLLRKMTTAASYVTRALLVLGAIMNSLIALKYIAGSKASTVDRRPDREIVQAGVHRRRPGRDGGVRRRRVHQRLRRQRRAAFAFDDTAAATVLLIFAIVFMLIMSAMRSFYMDPKLYLEGATKKASGLQTIIGVVCLISAIATLSQPPPPPTHTAGA